MSAFSSFCVPEVEGYGPVRVGDGSLKRLPIITQVSILDLSRDSATFGVTSTQPPCLHHIIASHDSAGICCIDAESTIRLIDANQLRLTSCLTGAHSAPVTSCSFLNHNSSILITSSQDGSIKLWDLREKAHERPANAAARSTLQIAPSGSREADMWALAVRGDDQLIAASFKNWIKGFDLRVICSGSAASSVDGEQRTKGHKRSKRLLWDMQVHGDVVAALQFHPRYPHLLVSGGEDSLVCMSDTTAAGRDGDSDSTPVACFSQERAVKGLSLVGPEASCICIRSAMEDVGLWQVEGLKAHCNDSAGVVSVQRRAEWLSVRSHPAIREGDSSGYVVDVFYDEMAGRLFILAGLLPTTSHSYAASSDG